jgi:hypothetical protein
MAVTANLGAGQNAGRFSTLPSNFENVRLVTGLGAAALTGPELSTAGAHALAGLIRSLPCYLTFCLVIALGAPLVGLPALALALLACLAAGHLTWRGVPRAPRVATAQ